MKNHILTLAVFFAAFTNAFSDVVVTKDGSQLMGTIKGIEGDKLTLGTAYAGDIEVSKDEIVQFSTDGEIFVSFDSGSTYKGIVKGGFEGELTIDTPDGELKTSMANVNESWQVGVESPQQKRDAAEIKKLQRNWSYEATFDLNGKSGNSDSTGLSTQFRAKLKGPDDALEFFAIANFEETDDLKSADDARGGVDYSSNISDKTSWYVRSELGRDVIKDIDLFVTSAAGFGYTPVNNERRTLTLRGGLSYRFESYDTGADDLSSAGLDLGLFHSETFSWGKIVNRITYTPVFEDFGNFRLVQDTALELPLKVEGWNLRLGFANDYSSEPQFGKDELDTTYYTRLVLKWD